MLSNVLKMVEKVIYIFLSLISFFIIAMVTCDVILRKFFGRSLIITEELARYLMVWLVFMGSCLAIKDDSHISIELLTKKLSSRSRCYVNILVHLIFIIFLIFLGVETLGLLPKQRYQTCITFDVSMFYFYLAMPVGCALMILFLISRITNELSALRKGGYTDKIQGA
ncbi:TRAP transporter small permease [Thermodesulforhabdus norvegica]|uniref:TRAP-type C4-dicarboxylate transport system, small permease component n=1 Tax=Thermodesulforhabdus norvegica TaxID=39841 RepID=A0A1I4R3L8_9BACT|nr:TRAP transporter small permease [Thermodesulforhabdus norvegica]SFM46725.1 TRAP-type C4-dicarboxylate transport system, small permease component [Thermodesulforhabdus norvegica]